MNQNKNRKIIYVITFLFSISTALTYFINSSFLEFYIDKYYVGIIFAISSIFSILGLLTMPKILNALGNYKTIIFASVGTFLSLLMLAFWNNVFIAIFSFVLYIVMLNIIVASLDIFVEDFSKNKEVGKMRGFYLMITNLA